VGSIARKLTGMTATLDGCYPQLIRFTVF